MTITLREARLSDLSFLRRMLYEAVFWRAPAHRPSFEEGLAYPDVEKALADWGKRAGDTGVVAAVGATPVGAAWYRFWQEADLIRGYVDEITPVVVIGVGKDYRRQGVGTRMLQWLIDYASSHAVRRISLMVAKDNVAINLYRQQGFLEYADAEEDFIMVREIRG